MKHEMKPKIARIYMRVSTNEQDLARQEALIEQARNNGWYVAGIYREKISGAIEKRPELERMIADIQAGDLIVAERIDRLTRLPLPEAERLVARIKDKGGKLVIPGVVDFQDLTQEASETTRIVLEGVQNMLLKLALQAAREDYELRRKRQAEGIKRAKEEGRYKGKQADKARHKQVIALRKSGHSITETARITGFSIPSVNRIWKKYREETGTPMLPRHKKMKG